jgi:hypothetical protein
MENLDVINVAEMSKTHGSVEGREGHVGANTTGIHTLNFEVIQY